MDERKPGARRKPSSFRAVSFPLAVRFSLLLGLGSLYDAKDHVVKLKRVYHRFLGHHMSTTTTEQRCCYFSTTTH